MTAGPHLLTARETHGVVHVGAEIRQGGREGSAVGGELARGELIYVIIHSVECVYTGCAGFLTYMCRTPDRELAGEKILREIYVSLEVERASCSRELSWGFCFFVCVRVYVCETGTHSSTRESFLLWLKKQICSERGKFYIVHN